MNGRKPSSFTFLIGLAAFCTGLDAAEPTPRVPWTQIEAWATGGAAKPDAIPEVTPTKTPAKPDVPSTTTPATDTPATPEPEPEPEKPGTYTGAKQTPKVWLERYAQISAAMGNRLRTTPSGQHRHIFEVQYLMEQYDQALLHLTAMLKDTRKWPEEDTTGWLSGRLWETALLQGRTPNPDALKKYFDDWAGKERARLKLQRSAGAVGVSTMKIQEQYFEAHQEYFNECKNIAEMIKQKEREGESNPAALWEMSERFYARHPDVPVVQLRYLYKLREWYPQYGQVRSGLVQQRIALGLAVEQLKLYKEAAEEMELLLEKWPKAAYAVSGSAEYYASLYWMYYGDQLKDRKASREAWRKALEHVQTLKADYPKSSYNVNDPDSGHSDTARQFRRIMDEERLGSNIGK